MKHKIKDGIEKSSISFGIKIKPLFNKISKEMGLICSEYNSIKSQISRNLNKKLHLLKFLMNLNIMMIYLLMVHFLLILNLVIKYLLQELMLKN